MALARTLVAPVGGFLLGGFIYLCAIDGAARAAIAAGGVSIFLWNGKIVSEINAIFSIYYALVLLPWLCLVGGHGAVIGLDALRCRRVPRCGRAQLVGLWWAGAAATLGALGAIAVDQWIRTTTYRDGTEPGSYLAATIHLGLPAMQSLPAAWQGGLLALLVVLGIAGGVERLHHVRGKVRNRVEAAID
ncbi:MAG TPA: hypothetical protein VIL85_25725 [Thermomicrobiales bacterium]|jgi:hypothetical protein